MKMPWIKFFPRDWQSETGLQFLGYAERGLWIDMICLMATGERYGYLSINGKPMDAPTIARMTRGDEHLVEQLLEHLLKQNVYAVDDDGFIFSRRMVRDMYIHEVRSSAGKSKHSHPKKNPESRIQNPEPRALLEQLLKQSMQRLGALYNRKEKTAWSAKEKRKLSELMQNEGFTEQLSAIEEYFLRKREKGEGQYLRHDLMTLMNNWNGELDRAAKIAVGSERSDPAHDEEVMARLTAGCV